MRIGKSFLLSFYRSRLTLYSHQGVEHSSDPDTFSIWIYFGFIGVALIWSRGGWIFSREAAMQETALIILDEAPDPQVQTPAFLDEWDRLQAEEDRIKARLFAEEQQRLFPWRFQ